MIGFIAHLQGLSHALVENGLALTRHRSNYSGIKSNQGEPAGQKKH